MAESQEVPLSGHPLFRSHDIDDARARVARVFCDHRLNPTERRPKLDALHNRVVLRNTALNFLRYGAPVRIDPGELETFFLVQIPLSGRAQISCGRESHVATVTEASVLSPTGRIAMDWDGNCGQVIVWLERNALEQQLADMIGRSLRAPLCFQLGMQLTEPRARSWLRIVQFLAEEIETGDSCFDSQATLAHFEHSLMTGLLYSQPHNYSHDIQPAGPNVAPSAVRRAEDYISAHLLDDVSIDDLAGYTGSSTRSLFENFRKFRHTSPLAHLRELRLAGARRELLEAAEGETVTSIAQRWRFSELGRFAQIYRRRFGENPSDTLRKSAHPPR